MYMQDSNKQFSVTEVRKWGREGAGGGGGGGNEDDVMRL